MNLDLESIKQALGAFGTALNILRQAKDLLPDSPKKEEVNSAIETAARQFKIAEAQVAQSMDYELCKKHFPPEIMLLVDDKVWKCPACGNEINNKHEQKLFNLGRR
jgi:hypothetical protein